MSAHLLATGCTHSLSTFSSLGTIALSGSRSEFVLPKLRSGLLIASTSSFDIRRVKCADGQFLVAKCAKKMTESTDRSLRRQFAALHELRSLPYGVLRDSVPEPVLFDEENGVLIMTVLPGSSFNTMLRSRANVVLGAFWRTRLHRIGYKVGEWLSRFHLATVSRPLRHVHHEFIAELEANLVRCGRQGISDEVLRRVRDRAKATSALQEGKPVYAAGSHGEFLPQNVLVRGVDIAVVDFDTYASGTPVYRDLSVFLAYLRLLASKPKYSRTAVNAVVGGFTIGYGNRFDPELLQLHLLKAVCEIITEKPYGRVLVHDRTRWEKVLLETGSQMD